MILRETCNFPSAPGVLSMATCKKRQAAVINLTKVMGKDYATLGKAMGKEGSVETSVATKKNHCIWFAGQG